MIWGALRLLKAGWLLAGGGLYITGWPGHGGQKGHLQTRERR